MDTPNNTLAERLGAITRSIASGHNACGTLMTPGGLLNMDFIAEAVKPTLQVYEDEAAVLHRENAELRRDVDIKRNALEFAVSNIPGIASMPGVGDAFFAALPGHPFLV